MTKCPYTSDCWSKDIDCYFAYNRNCPFLETLGQVKIERQRISNEGLRDMLEETRMQIERGGI